MNSNSAASMAVEHESSIARAVMAEIEHPLLSSGELALFARFGRPRQVPAGEVLFHRGESGGSMFVIIAGIVDMDFGEDLTIKYLGPGDFFGEMGLLIDGHRRNADARASTELALLELGQGDFQQMVEHAPAQATLFLRRTLMRVVSSEQALMRQLRRRNHDLEAALDNLYCTSHLLSHTEELVRTDELTGLHNRRGLALYLQECRRPGAVLPQGLLLIDCDCFKRVNDQHGHLAGDQVLQAVADILRAVVPCDGLACRLGGDEFCLLLPVADRNTLEHTARTILQSVKALLEQPQRVPRICPVSIGLCLLDPEQDWSDWYAHADNALYEAKRLGGNRPQWPPGLTAAS